MIYDMTVTTYHVLSNHAMMDYYLYIVEYYGMS